WAGVRSRRLQDHRRIRNPKGNRIREAPRRQQPQGIDSRFYRYRKVQLGPRTMYCRPLRLALARTDTWRIWILNFLDPEHASRQAGSRGPQRVGAGDTIATKLDPDLVPSLRGGRIDRQNPRLFSDSLLREKTLRQYQRQEANDASLQLPGRRPGG